MGAFLLSGLDSHLENGVLGSLGNAEFNHGLGWNLDLGARQRIAAHTSGAMLLDQLAQARKGHFTRALYFSISQSGQSIPQSHNVLLAHVRFLSQCLHQLGFGHLRHTCFRIELNTNVPLLYKSLAEAQGKGHIY